MSNKLALFGGDPAVSQAPGDMFTWPILTEEDDMAVLEVLHNRAMSGTNVTMEFERDFSAWLGCKRALGFCNATSALGAAMFACGLGHGDELISPSITYWASTVQAFSLGATVAFADIDPDTLCLDPSVLESCLSEKTKAIMVVHYVGYPADMDRIMAFAKKHGLKVIEDVSHAQGGLYKGRKLGSIGDVSVMSLMTGKSLVAGEGGMLATDDDLIWERAIAAGHYERFGDSIKSEELKPYIKLPMLGMKGRMHQMSAALGRVQLKYYDERSAEIRRSMNYFWDLLEGVPGIRAHRVDEKTGSNMGGWYAARGLFVSSELGGLSVSRFCEAVRAEGADCSPGCNTPLHTHALLQTADIYHQGSPTRIANASRDVRELDQALPHSLAANARTYSIPWFKHYRPDIIREYAEAFKKAALGYKELLPGDTGNPASMGLGNWNFFNSTRGKS